LTVNDYEFAVIGAGAAGLAAGLALQEARRNFIVLEARGRVGGRAFTDSTSFPGIAFDQGAHWLHAASQNPFTKIADALGFRYSTDIDWSHRALFMGNGKRTGRRMLAEAAASLMGALERFDAAGEEGRDIAFSELLDSEDPWYPLTCRTLSQITSHEPGDCSTLDYWRYDDVGGDFPVEDGYGALVARHANGLPVELSTPVTRINWSGKRVSVETPRGLFSAGAIILAVPVNVLIADGIRFEPALPPRLVEALNNCPMGAAEKFAVLLDRSIDGMGHTYADVIPEMPIISPPVNLHINPFGRPMLISHLGGAVARDLEKAGDQAMHAVAMEAMVQAFGSAIRQRVRKTLFTHWTSDPWTRGGYSHCRPGHAAARKVFTEPVGGRIVLAGEHCSQHFYSTVHGAHLSGLAAAKAAMALQAPA
jgi:monoamine oxidase